MTVRRTFRKATVAVRRSLRSRADFLRIQKGALKAWSAHFLFLVGASSLGPEARARLGIVVTKKVGNAVARNRIKRTTRETFRKLPNFVPNGVDLVVIARGQAESLTQPEVQAEWEGAKSAVRKMAARVAPFLDRNHVARQP